MALWNQFTDDCGWSIMPVRRYTSLLTVIDHAGPVSDPANPVIDPLNANAGDKSVDVDRT
jgi:hypothetical protein